MKSIPSYRQPGEVVPVIAPYNVAAGDVVVVGGIVGLAATPATAGTSVEVCTTGVFAMKAATAEVIAAGAAVYWDSVAGNITQSVTATKLGNLIAAKASGVAEALVRVVLTDGIGFLRGQLQSGVWFMIPSIFRLRLTGTGSVVVDARDALGNVTTAVATYTVTGATDQIEFPYAGDDAVAIRATLTGTATAEVI